MKSLCISESVEEHVWPPWEFWNLIWWCRVNVYLYPKDSQCSLLTYHPEVYLVSFKDLGNSKSGDFFFLTLKLQQVPRNKTAFLYQVSYIKGNFLSTCIIWFLCNLPVTLRLDLTNLLAGRILSLWHSSLILSSLLSGTILFSSCILRNIIFSQAVLLSL